MVLSDKCRINSFTWLELAGRGDKCDRRQSRDTLSCINKPEKNEQRKMNFPKIYVWRKKCKKLNKCKAICNLGQQQASSWHSL